MTRKASPTKIYFDENVLFIFEETGFPFLVIFTLSCFIRDRAIESDLTSLILNVSLTCEIKSQIF
jgi:hypothetical protein